MVKRFISHILFILGFFLQIYSVLITFSYFTSNSILYKIQVLFKFFKTGVVEYNIFLSMTLGAFFIFLAFSLSGFKLFNVNYEKKKEMLDYPVNNKLTLGENFFFKLLIATIFSLTLFIIPHKYLLLQYIVFLLMFVCLLTLLDLKKIKERIYSCFEIDNKDIRNIILLCSLYFVSHIYFLTSPAMFHWGDEGAFFDIASGFIRENFSKRSFFDQFGVYGKNPISSSIVQALMILPFGVSIFSFRLTSLFSIMASIVPIYLIAKLVTNRNVSIIASLLICFSHYFYNFTYLSYNNILGLPLASFATLFFLIAIIKCSLNASILCGIFAGLCWYQYGIAILSILAFLPSMLFVISRKTAKNNFKCFFIIYYIMLLFIVPMYFRVSVEENLHYFMQNASNKVSDINQFTEIMRRLKIAFFNTFVHGANSHWMFKTPQDIFSQCFFFVGIFVIIKHIFKCIRLRLFFIFTLFVWFLIGILNVHTDFTNTRLMYILVYWIIITSIGIEVFIKYVFTKKIFGSIAIISLISFLNYEYAFCFPFKYVHVSRFETSIVEVANDNDNIGSIYALYREKTADNHHQVYFDGYQVMKNIIIVQKDRLDKLPQKLHKTDVILINIEDKDYISKIANRYEAQSPYILHRKNLKNRAQVYIIGLKETLTKYLDESSIDEILLNRVIL